MHSRSKRIVQNPKDECARAGKSSSAAVGIAASLPLKRFVSVMLPVWLWVFLSTNNGGAWSFPNGHLKFHGKSFFPIGIADFPGGEQLTNMVRYSSYINTIDWFDHDGKWDNYQGLENISPGVFNQAGKYHMAVILEMWEFTTGYEAEDWLIDPNQLKRGTAFCNELQWLNAYSGVTGDGPLLMIAQQDEADTTNPQWYDPSLSKAGANYKFMRQQCPDVPVWFNSTPCDGYAANSLAYYRQWAATCDIFSFDVYAGAYRTDAYTTWWNMDNALSIAGRNKPRLLWVAAYASSRDGTDYDYNQMAYIIYEGIIHGADGIMWWGGDQTTTGSKTWQAVVTIGGQLMAMEGALANCDWSVCRYFNHDTSRQITRGICATGDNDRIEMLKVTGPSACYLICVNTDPKNGHAVTINSVSGWWGSNLYNFAGGSNSMMGSTVAFSPAQVIIFCANRR